MFHFQIYTFPRCPTPQAAGSLVVWKGQISWMPSASCSTHSPEQRSFTTETRSGWKTRGTMGRSARWVVRERLCPLALCRWFPCILDFKYGCAYWLSMFAKAEHVLVHKVLIEQLKFSCRQNMSRSDRCSGTTRIMEDSLRSILGYRSQMTTLASTSRYSLKRLCML